MDLMAEPNEDRSRKIAVEYRNLVLFFGGQLTLALVNGVGKLTMGGVASEVLRNVVSFGLLGSTAALMYFTYRTARALGSEAPWGWAVGMLVPYVSILTLILLSRRAQERCNAAGIPVGFLGPKLTGLAGPRQNREAAQQAVGVDEAS
jgi:hypothetical protein